VSDGSEDRHVRRRQYRGEIFQNGRFAQLDAKGLMPAQATPIPAAPAEAASTPKTLPRIGSAVIVLDGSSVLLGVRNKEPNRGKWVLPGGRVRPFESIDDAARREILEETGLEIHVEGQLGVWEIINPPAEHRVIVYSLARRTGGVLKASSDLSEVRFWNTAELDQVDLTPTVRSVLKSALER
jgi:acetyl-CoA carboxylase carboxyl transferase subunit beta